MNLMVHWIISSCKITFLLQLWNRIELKHFFVGLLIFRKSTVGLRCCLMKKILTSHHWPPLPLVEEDVGLRIVIIHLPALSLNPNELLSDMNRALQKLSFGQWRPWKVAIGQDWQRGNMLKWDHLAQPARLEVLRQMARMQSSSQRSLNLAIGNAGNDWELAMIGNDWQCKALENGVNEQLTWRVQWQQEEARWTQQLQGRPRRRLSRPDEKIFWNTKPDERKWKIR